MKTCITLVVLAGLCLCAGFARAAVPASLSYQGYLADVSGASIDGNVVITFSIYAVEFGGAPLWSDTQLVNVAQGLFSVELGGLAAPFPVALFDTPIFLGIAVAPDTEMLPRRALRTAAFAFKANDAFTLDGQSAASLDQSGHVLDTNNPHGVTAAQAGAAVVGDIASLQSQLDAASNDIAALLAGLAAANSQIVALQSALAAETAARVAADNAEMAIRSVADALHDGDITTIQANTVLALDGRLGLSDGNTALFSGVNLQVVNGLGRTDTVNGLGNVLVGYDAVTSFPVPVCSLGEYDNQLDCESNSGVWANSHKSGSHSVIVGDEHNYSRFGSILGGFGNHATGAWSSAVGGRENFATGFQSTIAGGRNNNASGNQASILGGSGNNASGLQSTAAGGNGNTASGQTASSLGGANNTAAGANATATAGFGNLASGDRASVSGGQQNTAEGFAASVGGGRNNFAHGDYSSVQGGGASTVGSGNHAFGHYSAVLGGTSNRTGDPFDPDAGEASTISGGLAGITLGREASISGGQSNEATARAASVSGGIFNNAYGYASTVSGGQNRTASDEADWVAGSLMENN